MIYYIVLAIFVLSVFLLLQSYLFYPTWLLLTVDFQKSCNDQFYLEDDELPDVAILISAHNEDKVIAQKIESTMETAYPISKITIYIGSDASNDKTNEIVQKYASLYPQIKLVVFTQRTGKPDILNRLYGITESPILILSDANIIFTRKTIPHLVKHFKNPEINLVAGNIIKGFDNNACGNKTGISKQGIHYLEFENKLKHAESIKWKLVMGAEGGCMAVRRKSYAPIPSTFLVDDFYITMHVLQEKGKAIFEPESVCYEDTLSEIKAEFARRVRISIGNFQNMLYYKKLLLSCRPGISIAFLSHKVLRWLSPFFLILCFVSSIILTQYALLFVAVVFLQSLFFFTPLLGKLLDKFNVTIEAIKSLEFFYMMNLALLKGFYIYITGVKSNIWTPTKRNL